MTSTITPTPLAPDASPATRPSNEEPPTDEREAVPGATDQGTDQGADHLARLRAATRSLATRATGAETERWLLRAGAVMVPAGFVAIVLGYWGAAHSSRVIQQIPYQISGGLLGVALVFAGAFAYFSYWSTRILREQQRIAHRLDEQTREIVGELRALREATAATTDGGVSVVDALVVTPRGTYMHRPTCSVVAGRDDLLRADPAAPEARPCKVCAPDLGDRIR